jgi:periplasmic protein TonB
MHGVYEVSEQTKSEPLTASRAERNVAETKLFVRPSKVDFASGMLENSDLKQPRRSLDFLVSLAGQAAFVALLILLPLVYTQAFDVSGLEKTVLVIPPPPPPPPKAEPHVVVKPRASLFEKGKLIAPRVIPNHVAVLKEAPQELPGPPGVSGGVIGGVEGGTLGGVLGGVLSGSQPPPPPRPAKVSGPIRVGGRIQAPHLTNEVQPEYPVLAKETRTQGNVVLDCVIDPQGNVTQMRLVSGHPLLVPAALKAVQQWKYQPTLLNGQPVAVEMKVTVTFSLGGQ